MLIAVHAAGVSLCYTRVNKARIFMESSSNFPADLIKTKIKYTNSHNQANNWWGIERSTRVWSKHHL